MQKNISSELLYSKSYTQTHKQHPQTINIWWHVLFSEWVKNNLLYCQSKDLYILLIVKYIFFVISRIMIFQFLCMIPALVFTLLKTIIISTECNSECGLIISNVRNKIRIFLFQFTNYNNDIMSLCWPAIKRLKN